MEQLSPQQVRSSLSGGQEDSDGTQYNAGVTEHTTGFVQKRKHLKAATFN